MTEPSVAGPASGTTAGPQGRLLARNSLLNLLGMTAPLLVGVLAMPPVVDGLGADRFGVLGLVWTAFGYLALLDLGLARATTKFAAEALARGDRSDLAALARTAAAAQLAIGAVVAAAGVLAAGPLVAWLNVPAPLRESAHLAFVLIALTAPAMGIGNTFRGVLEAGQRFGLVNLIRTPSSAATFLIPLLGVWLDWTLLGIVAVMVGARVASLAAYAVAAARVWPGVVGVGLDRGRLRSMLGFGSWVSVSSVVSPLLVYVDRFVIGALLTVAAVGYYTAPHEMVMRLAILPAAIATALFPAFAAMAALGDSGPRTDVLFARALKYVLALTAPPLLFLAAFAEPLLELWLGSDFAVRAGPALCVLSLGMICNAAAHVPYTLVQARGRADLTARLHLVELPLHVLLVWQLTSRYGITGAASAWTLRVALDAALLFALTRRMQLVPPGTLMRERLPLAAFSLLVCGAAITGVAAVPVQAGMRFALGGSILLTWSLFAWRRALGAAERAELIAAVGRRTQAGSSG